MNNNDKQVDINHYAGDDEIDLFELLGTIYAGKYIIIAVTLICLILAGGAAWLMTPVYKSTVTFLPPAEIDIQEINKFSLVDSGRFKKFTPDQLFQLLLENLTDGELIQEIFNDYQLETLYAPQITSLPVGDQPIVLERAIVKFGEDLSISQPGRNDTTPKVTLSLALKLSPEKTASVLNDLSERAQQITVDDIYSAILTERNNYIKQTFERISSLRKIAGNRRSDRIVQLNEAITIARSLDIAEPREMGPEMAVQGVSNQGLPLYSLGYRYLEAERNTLERRKNDDPFIPELRNLQERISLFEDKSLNKDLFQVVRLTQRALPPTRPEKPKSILMLALAGVAGIMLGTMFVLVRQAIVNRRKSDTTQESK